MAALLTGSQSSATAECWLQGVQRDKTRKWERMFPSASSLKEANMVAFILDLVAKVFKINTNTQHPSPLSLCVIC